MFGYWGLLKVVKGIKKSIQKMIIQLSNRACSWPFFLPCNFPSETHFNTFVYYERSKKEMTQRAKKLNYVLQHGWILSIKKGRRRSVVEKREAKSQYSYLLAKCLLNSPFFCMSEICYHFATEWHIQKLGKRVSRSTHFFSLFFKKDTLEI